MSQKQTAHFAVVLAFDRDGRCLRNRPPQFGRMTRRCARFLGLFVLYAGARDLNIGLAAGVLCVKVQGRCTSPCDARDHSAAAQRLVGL